MCRRYTEASPGVSLSNFDSKWTNVKTPVQEGMVSKDWDLQAWGPEPHHQVSPKNQIC